MPRGNSWRGKNQTFILVLGVIFAVLVVSVVAPALDPLPGFEGETNFLYGYQPASQSVSTLNQPLRAATGGACSYAWNGVATPASGSVVVTSPDLGQCAVGANVDYLDMGAQNNLANFTGGASIPIKYYVPVPGQTDKSMLVYGTIEEYNYTLNVNVEASSSGVWNFGGDTIWYSINDTVWNNASIDPLNSSVSGNVFETPLYGVVWKVVWSNQADSSCSLCVKGSALSFYALPSTSGQTSSLTDNKPPTAELNTSLSSIYAPDTRLQSVVYYPLNLEHFENNCVLGQAGIGCTPPQATISITVYTLKIGQYIVTNPNKQSLTPPGGPCTGLDCFFLSVANGLASIDKFLSNPLGQLSTVIIIVAVLIVAILLLSAILGIRIPFLAAGAGRRRGGMGMRALAYALLVGGMILGLYVYVHLIVLQSYFRYARDMDLYHGWQWVGLAVFLICYAIFSYDVLSRARRQGHPETEDGAGAEGT